MTSNIYDFLFIMFLVCLSFLEDVLVRAGNLHSPRTELDIW